MTARAAWLAIGATFCLARSVPAYESPLLRGGSARFSTSGESAHGAIRLIGAPSAGGIADPRCPARSRVRIAWSFDDVAEVELPCANWSGVPGGYRYADPAGAAGGIQTIRARSGKFAVRLGGPMYRPIVGPLPFVEVALNVGDEGMCGRFSRFASQQPQDVRTAGAPVACRLPRPNFLVVVLDDVRADGIDWMPIVQDELAGRGVAFANAFVPDAVCCPSRASILTGLYALRHGTLQVGGPIGGADRFRQTGADRQTLAVWLADAGYATGLFGKYLNDYAASERMQGPNGTFYVPPGWERWWAFVSPEHYGGVLGQSYEIVDERGAVTSYVDHSSDAEYSTDLSAAEVRRFISDAAAAGRPFFAYWAPYAGHGETPGILPAPAVRHSGLFASLPPWRPANWDENDVSDKPQWVRHVQAELEGEEGEVVAGITDAFRQKQYESLLAADEQLGHILATLADLGIEQDTVVILTSDNGVGWGEHQSWGTKESPYEEAIRVPLLVRYPRRVAARSTTVGATALNIDLAPTIAALAGAGVPFALDGVNLDRWLAGTPPTAWRGDFLLEFWRTNRGARVNYFARPADGDRLRVFYGDPRAEPRPSIVLEFDSDGRVGSDATPVPIAEDEDTTFANFASVTRAAVPGAMARVNTTGNSLVAVPGDPFETLLFREDVDRGRFVALEPVPDFLGLRDVANGYTWVEYETGERELYDLMRDPAQLDNRADDPAYAHVRASLAATLDARLAEVEARAERSAR